MGTATITKIGGPQNGSGNNYDLRGKYYTFINESGFYSLVLSSKLETAKKFKKWVTSEVLPSLRKYGYFKLFKLENETRIKQRVIIDGVKYYRHPVFDNYAASKNGDIISLKTKRIMSKIKQHSGYFSFNIYDEKLEKPKMYYQHRFIYEVFKGAIPRFFQIDHINNCKKDNRLKNLQLLTPTQNNQKSNNKAIISINIETCEEKKYVSIIKAAIELEICAYNIYKYPIFFKGVYMIAYGIVGTFSNIDPDKVYDYHTAFDIKPTEVMYNVNINANQKVIKNVKLDKSVGNSVATVAMVKELIPYTTNYFYRQYFEEFYDFADANNYGINIGSSGVIINSLKPNITIPNKDLSSVKKEGLDVVNYNVTFSPPSSSKYTLCIVFYHWRNRNFTLTKYLSSNNNVLLKLNYDKTNNKVILTVGQTTGNTPLPSDFNGKRIVVWLAVKFDSNVTKVKISNYSSSITMLAVNYNVNQRWRFTTEDGLLVRLMYSKNFYDFESEQFHKVMLQEKLNGSYIL